MSELPRAYERFGKRFPAVFKAYQELGLECQNQGPLDAKTRELVKLGIATGARLEGAVHSHVRRALEAGATAEEIRQVVLLALTTIGFPSMMAALTWVDDILGD